MNDNQFIRLAKQIRCLAFIVVILTFMQYYQTTRITYPKEIVVKYIDRSIHLNKSQEEIVDLMSTATNAMYQFSLLPLFFI